MRVINTLCNNPDGSSLTPSLDSLDFPDEGHWTVIGTGPNDGHWAVIGSCPPHPHWGVIGRRAARAGKQSPGDHMAAQALPEYPHWTVIGKLWIYLAIYIIQHIYNLKGLNKKCPFYLGHHCFLVNALVLQSITKNKFRYAYRTFFKLALFCTLHESLNICATYYGI